MSKQYFLSNNGSHIGPFPKEEILGRIKSQEATWTDYVYDESFGDWKLLLEHPDFSSALTPSLKPPAFKPSGSSEKFTEVKEKGWYILKEGNNYGPFSRLDIVQMLQERSLYEYDYLWHAEMESWKKVSEVSVFSPEAIRDLKASGIEGVNEVFFRRRHARARYGASMVVHNNKSVYKGKSIELSLGGAGIVVESPGLEIGQTLYLHFKPGDGVPPFNAVCQVVSKQQLRNIPHGPGTPVKYGVKFTSITQKARESIRSFTEPKAA